MEELKNKLFEAATQGSLTSLQKLLTQDPLILQRDVTNHLSETPLHVAAMLGHTDFVKEVARINPQLAAELNSVQSSPLHLASAKGHVDVVKVLLSAYPKPCLVRDRNGMTPLHVAAVNGRIEVMKVLITEALDAAQLMVNRGETIIHVCVKYRQLEALKLLLDNLGNRECLNMKDVDGNTLLHLAVAYKQVETIKFLLSVDGLDVNAQNPNGMTVVDILIHNQRETRDVEIQEFLKHAGERVDHNTTADILMQSKRDMKGVEIQEPLKHIGERGDHQNVKETESGQNDWLEKKRGALMIVASLIATVAFQAGVTPPGGVWQEDKGDHKAGKSVLGQNQRGYTIFYACNTVSLVSSLSIILLLVSGLPLRSRFFVWILMVVTWIAISATTLTYAFAIGFVTPSQNDDVLNIVVGTIYGWLVLMVCLLIGHMIRLIVRGVKALKRWILKAFGKRTRRKRAEITVPPV